MKIYRTVDGKLIRGVEVSQSRDVAHKYFGISSQSKKNVFKSNLGNAYNRFGFITSGVKDDLDNLDYSVSYCNDFLVDLKRYLEDIPDSQEFIKKFRNVIDEFNDWVSSRKSNMTISFYELEEGEDYKLDGDSVELYEKYDNIQDALDRNGQDTVEDLGSYLDVANDLGFDPNDDRPLVWYKQGGATYLRVYGPDGDEFTL